MPLTYSKGMPVGTAAPDFSLPGTDGRLYSLTDFANSPVLVVIFTCNHCPYAIACEDRFIALQADYKDRGVQLVAINPNDATRYPDDNFEAMVVRSQEKSFNFPYLQDASQAVAQAYDAACTPDIFVFDGERKLAYNGRLDDNWQEPEQVSRHDLRDVLEALLTSGRYEGEVHPSLGCSIKWKEGA